MINNNLKAMREEINEMDCEMSCKKQAIIKLLVKAKKELEERFKEKNQHSEFYGIIREVIGE